ncbi:hypothetical protein JNUCC0626_14545 [Lentzea sp. JNUCC 0626]|uniref:hypothetical protein n=1 Tax=Lentzea sp. JNUCC 0626 TaxID=3367513 RepID=UPI00374958B3
MNFSFAGSLLERSGRLHDVYDAIVAGELDLGLTEEGPLCDDDERLRFIAYLEERFVGDKYESMAARRRELRFQSFLIEMREWDWGHMYVQSAYNAARHPDRGSLMHCTPQPGGGFLLNVGPDSRPDQTFLLADDEERLAFVAFLEKRYGNVAEWEESEHQRYQRGLHQGSNVTD